MANLCCAAEEKIVKARLEPLEGVDAVAVNVIGRIAYVTHDANLVDGPALCAALNKAHLGASIAAAREASGAAEEEEASGVSKECVLLVAAFAILIVGVVGIYAANVSGFERRPGWKYRVAAAASPRCDCLAKRVASTPRPRRLYLAIMRLTDDACCGRGVDATQPTEVAAPDFRPVPLVTAHRWLLLGLAVVGAAPIAMRASIALRRKELDINCLVIIAIVRRPAPDSGSSGSLSHRPTDSGSSGRRSGVGPRRDLGS